MTFQATHPAAWAAMVAAWRNRKRSTYDEVRAWSFVELVQIIMECPATTIVDALDRVAL